ncbi:uncharacterized protein LOC130159419 isoform X1 [Falco biarmicus]|uniref:uncharacterized protein LOC114018089 isoform X1 n=1 Tax=Falco cherrug TaxID=345164 RepID=UPI000FFB2699|nr:uncharacterized protein LOC114018089 isoform X1 [Falco cherrug]XP_027672489.1 uncharacterized protein LOC114018089 isoform X1 [Falco cherrug]XP_055578138.1 uncharacterized protein LOC114018089 isoform X1 [Falco cherrug]XP_055578152.1 uncharacterized protein LOC114018089 isoform X1 [Falco cherrug]XP_055578159.1 uncharacterized protein LOC114018089 isoform X1 [Falco cherrug]XP_055578169.1 uncharacterized protein LOC114018089 isoform X1 [Falco cherrug]XP_055578176.1 uncharacterized protein LO
MESPYFTWFCFLLLAIAAAHPNIAMPCGGDPAEGSQRSSSGKTNVTVYHCKNCEEHICKSSNYEGFVKIGETQSETFSNEVIQLVTSETHIMMCLQQEENACLKGIYAIVWEKAMGVGDSCGTLDFKVSSENREDNIVREEMKICCKVDTNLSVPSRVLKCGLHNVMSGGENRKSAADITAEGNQGERQFSVSQGNITLTTTLLIAGVCAAALLTYHICRKQNHQGSVPVIKPAFCCC